jgi:hypothetical protein
VGESQIQVNVPLLVRLLNAEGLHSFRARAARLRLPLRTVQRVLDEDNPGYTPSNETLAAIVAAFAPQIPMADLLLVTTKTT